MRYAIVSEISPPLSPGLKVVFGENGNSAPSAKSQKPHRRKCTRVNADSTAREICDGPAGFCGGPAGFRFCGGPAGFKFCGGLAAQLGFAVARPGWVLRWLAGF